MQQQQQQQQSRLNSASTISTNLYSSDSIDMAGIGTVSRRSIDWRDSGIVIDDDDYQTSFNSPESASSEQQQAALSRSNLNAQNEQHQNRYSLQFATSSLANPHSYEFNPFLSQQSFSQQDNDGDTLLHLAVVAWPEEKIQDLIEISDLNAINNMRQSPLHIAILANRPNVVDLLVKQPGIKLDCIDRRGNAPIHLACQSGLKGAIETMLDKLRAIHAEDGLASSKLDSLIELTNFEGLNCLHVAALNDRRDVIELLITKYEANLNSRDSKSGETILHKAISKLNVQLVNLILDLSAQHKDSEQRHFNKTDYSGKGPLDKTRVWLESRPDDPDQFEKLTRITQMISERARICSDLGCGECSSSKSERNLKLITRSQEGILVDDESNSSSSGMSTSEYSDSDDYETD